jgi:hypothetical protein
MGRYMDMIEKWEREQQESGANTIDGHSVKEILWQTPRVTVFSDEIGRIWRRVHSWGMTWPVVMEKRK